MRMKRGLLVLALLSLIPAQASFAEMSRADQKKAEKLADGKFYLRMDAPCATGRHPYGVYHRPLIEVSPEGANTDVQNEVNVGWWHADSTDWSVRVNDAVNIDSVDYDESDVEVEVEGTDESDGRDTVVKLIHINTYADFEAAFNQVFSRTPLEEEHQDWPVEIRKAIRQRKLQDGMSKRQVFYVVGQPETVEKKTEGKKDIETWTLRAKGVEFGFFSSTISSQGGRVLTFQDGKLKLDASKKPGNELDLDH